MEASDLISRADAVREALRLYRDARENARDFREAEDDFATLAFESQMEAFRWMVMVLMALPGKDNNVPTKGQNEPLTLDELREMNGQPVWVTPLGFWALVIAKPGERVQLMSNDGEKVWADKEIELVGPVYRRPPEGGL